MIAFWPILLLLCGLQEAQGEVPKQIPSVHFQEQLLGTVPEGWQYREALFDPNALVNDQGAIVNPDWNRIAYAAQRQGKWRAFVGSAGGEVFDAIGKLAFLADGTLIYDASDDVSPKRKMERRFIIAGQKKGETFESPRLFEPISGFQVGPDHRCYARLPVGLS